MWSGGVPTPAIAELNAELPLRILDISSLAAPMSHLAGYPYVVRRVPTGGYVPPGIRSIGVPDLLLCRHDIAADLVAAVVDVLATDAPQLVPPYVRGLQYLAPPSMIQTGLIPLHPGAVGAYRRAARLSVNLWIVQEVRRSSRFLFRVSDSRAHHLPKTAPSSKRAVGFGCNGGGCGPGHRRRSQRHQRERYGPLFNMRRRRDRR